MQKLRSAFLASKKSRWSAWRQGRPSLRVVAARQWRILAARRPAQVAVGALAGIAFGALMAAVLGALSAVGAALVSGSSLLEVAEHLPFLTFVVVPTLAWTLARVPAGIGGLVGAACAAVPGSWAGLEWALVGGLGAALGAGARYGRWEPALCALAAGGMLGGAVGLRGWLAQRQGHLAPPTRGMWVVYGLTTLLVAVYTWVMIDWAAIL